MNNYNPFVLMFYFLSAVIISAFSENPVLQISALTGAILFCMIITKRSETAGNIGFYVPMFFIIAVTNPLFSHNGATPLFFLNGNPVTLEAFIYGIAIAVMAIGVMLWCKCYSEIMTTDKFLYIFGKTVPKLSLVLSMALKFIPMYKQQTRRVSRAQKAMGLYSSKSVTDKVRSHARVFMAMVSWSLENSIETSSSMKARSYGLKGRTNFVLFKFGADDLILLAVIVILLGVTVFGIMTGETRFYYYPKISRLKFSAAYIAFGIFSLLPFIIEVKEAIKWRYCISKI